MSGDLVHGSFVVPAGDGRNYKFDGVLLATSSSRKQSPRTSSPRKQSPRKPSPHRWVEFALYRSDGGTYVLARVGHSLLYHRPDCVTVGEYDLRIGAAPADGVPCELCVPAPDDGVVCPETPRPFAAMYKEPAALVRSLERDGASGRYMTHVAARLMEQAAAADPGLGQEWGSVEID